MGKTLSLEEVQTKITKISPNIKIIGNYVNTRTKVLCKCEKCGYEWYTTSDKLMQGRGCPSCSKKIKGMTLEKYQKLEAKHIKMIGKYQGTKIPTTFKCLICGYTWKAEPYDVLNKSGCPKCHKCAKPSEDEIQYRLDKYNLTYIRGTYIDSTVHKMKVKCNKCGRIFEALPCNLFHGSGCPHCNKSKGETFIEVFLTKRNIDFTPQYCIHLPNDSSKNRFIDFYIPKLNLFIEYNGIQHYTPIEYFGGKLQFNKQQERDMAVRKYCIDNNINLVEIPYTDTLTDEYMCNILNKYK